ncbi:MAG: N-acetyltransferase [Planctomycetota bacterium]|nr:N-acetyltransferase [Planctomycetota bacterium]
MESARDRRSFRAFLRLPWRIYRDDPLWVPPVPRQVEGQFDRDRYPFFRRGDVQPFVAWRGEEPVGRIAAIQNRTHQEVAGDRLGYFGFLEMVNDPEVARALFREAGDWLRERGLDRMLGPVQFTTNETCGVLVEGFDEPPAIQMPYNPPYYPDLLEEVGLKTAKVLLAYELTPDSIVFDKTRRVADRAERRGIRVRQLNLRDFDAEVERAREIYNQAWSANWGFDAISREEFHEMSKDLRRGADPRLLLMAETEAESRPIGCSISLPDLNPAIRLLDGRLTPWGLLRFWRASRKIKRMRTVLLGVVRGWRLRGVDALLMRETVDRGLAAGYESAELSWILEDNEPMNRALRGVGARESKRYRLYEGDLPTSGRPDR